MNNGRTLTERMRKALGRMRWPPKRRCARGPEQLAFTPRAKRVLDYAQDEACRLNHPYLGTEHLLLGLLREQEGAAGKVLNELGLTLAEARHDVEAIVGRGTKTPAGADPAMTQMANTAITHAFEEARQLNHNYAGTEHLLLSLVRTREGVAMGVLEQAGVSREQLRGAVLRLWYGDPGGSAATL